MTTISKWQNVTVAMQSALATAITITAITKASPGVATYTGTDPANGDYFLFATVGMSQVNGRVFRVASVNTGTKTFQLEGEDTTLYDTFTSGSAQKITFGTSFTTITGVSASGGSFDFIDTTTIHTNVKSQIPGPASPATYSFESIWDVSDTGLIAAKSASDSQAQRCFKFTFGTGGQLIVFNGYVGATLLPTGNAQDKVVTACVVTMFGRPTVYAS